MAGTRLPSSSPATGTRSSGMSEPPLSGAAGRAAAWENHPGARGAGQERGGGIPRTRGDECCPPSPRRCFSHLAPKRRRARSSASAPQVKQRDDSRGASPDPRGCLSPQAVGPLRWPTARIGSPWGRGRRGSPGGHGPPCPRPVKDCPGSREKRPCPLSPPVPWGQSNPGGQVAQGWGRVCCRRRGARRG